MTSHPQYISTPIFQFDHFDEFDQIVDDYDQINPLQNHACNFIVFLPAANTGVIQ